MKRVLFLVAGFLIFYNGFSQPSGYIGKTNVVSYKMSFLPTVHAINYRLSNLPSLNTTHSFSYERNISNRVTISATLSKFTNKICANFRDIHKYPREIKFWGVFNYHGTLFEVDIKTYMGGWVAPVGLYVGYGLSVNNISFSGIENLTVTDNFYFDDGMLKEIEYEIYDDPFDYYTFNFKSGKKSMINDNLSVDFGLNASVILSHSNKFVLFDEESFLYEMVKKRRNSKLFNLYFSIGYAF
ncbi:MAG: hypothetical protein A2W91_09055 [Bacteroidetes bacterium GWF2_38_335]|nr:MAG: hypothetical protein A2W91_09055 [Bacteroidetes bacterium GWF2_38_335]OFY80519.1 MAG: hypothetical protein A2281_08780 [Bacteroidetes bacterium RIFOXYA12_FULL_38_20]HBS85870.1 hypothetical protein [Bacteroidales bacterium]